MDGNLTASDVALLTGNNRNDGMFGGDGAWWLIVLFLFAFCGWGNSGWGNNGNGGGYVATAATQADIQRGFDNSAVISKLDGINSGLCDGFYAMNNGMLTGFNGINTNIMQTGFGIQQAINADTVANMQNTNALQAQLANCCCETREAIQGINYNMAQNTCALQNTMNSNTRGGAIMRDIKDLCARIEDELSKIADSGLTTGNLEMTYKLIDMYKDIKNTYYWDKKVEYYNTVLDEMRSGYNDDYSERGRKRDSMGRYSSNDGRMMPDYDRGNSYARRGEHYVRGHYSRSDGRDAYDDYMTQKQSYRSGKSEDCKRKMLAALEEHLDELTTEMSDMSKDAECREERDLVKRYVEKLRDML